MDRNVCTPTLQQIALLRPSLIIAELKAAVGRVHRVSRAGHEFEVIVLPHPSGRSTWTNKPENAALLAKSLRLIQRRMQ